MASAIHHRQTTNFLLFQDLVESTPTRKGPPPQLEFIILETWSCDDYCNYGATRLLVELLFDLPQVKENNRKICLVLVVTM